MTATRSNRSSLSGIVRCCMIWMRRGFDSRREYWRMLLPVVSRCGNGFDIAVLAI